MPGGETNMQPPAPWYRPLMARLLDTETPWHAEDAPLWQAAVAAATAPGCDEAHFASALTALTMRGETAADLAVTAELLRRKMQTLQTHGQNAVDTCGTGGDGSGTFNISTAVALVLAGAGLPVVKHGNRSVSSRSGSADVLAALGLPVEAGPAWAQACFDRTGFAFCYAPSFHPVMRHVAPIRRKLGFRTLFNLIGPLLNPASVTRQLIGVDSDRHADLLLDAARSLGLQPYFVTSDDGLDEVSLAAPAHLLYTPDDGIKTLQFITPDAFGLEPAPLENLKIDGPEQSAAMLLSVLKNEASPAQRVVLANAAVAMVCFGEADDWLAGVDRARDSIASGRALGRLHELKRVPLPETES
jgi:anthranilate phosphoribosyltransferase